MTLLSSFGALPTNLHVNYYFEVCSLIILVAITVAYFSRKKFPVSTYRLFGVGLVTLVVNVSLCILFCVLLDNSNVVHIGWVEAVAEIYFFMQIVESYLLYDLFINHYSFCFRSHFPIYQLPPPFKFLFCL